MKSIPPIARTHASTAATAVGPATNWAESLGGGVGEDPVRLGRQTCWAVWQEDLAAFEVQQPRGDYLRSMVSSFEWSCGGTRRAILSREHAMYIKLNRNSSAIVNRSRVRRTEGFVLVSIDRV